MFSDCFDGYTPSLHSGIITVSNSNPFALCIVEITTFSSPKRRSDSLNCSVLGEDAIPGTAEFDIFIKEVQKEMTVKAGQKCTAIRRASVPASMTEAVSDALVKNINNFQLTKNCLKSHSQKMVICVEILHKNF